MALGPGHGDGPRSWRQTQAGRRLPLLHLMAHNAEVPVPLLFSVNAAGLASPARAGTTAQGASSSPSHDRTRPVSSERQGWEPRSTDKRAPVRVPVSTGPGASTRFTIPHSRFPLRTRFSPYAGRCPHSHGVRGGLTPGAPPTRLPPHTQNACGWVGSPCS